MRFCVTCGRRFEEELRFCPDDGARTELVPEDEVTQVLDKLIGRTVDGRYRIEQKIGEGGMGNVYLATHVVLNRKLALKVLAGDMARNPEVVQRFQQEAQSATAIGHQNIIDIQDFGRLPDGTAYFVMEYLAGTSLTGLLEAEGALELQAILKLARQIAEALDAAHARGIVHRDLKPDNIYVIERAGDPRFVKVLDFGIAKVGGTSSRLTQTGVIFGTPHYMAPEQAAGQAVDHRADIYSLGVILYEMSVGKVPFDADTYMGILSKHMFEQPPVDPTAVPGRELGALKAVVLKALAKKPDERYQTMRDLIADFDAVAEGRTTSVAVEGAQGAAGHETRPVRSEPPVIPGAHRSRTRLITAAGVALGLLGAGSWFVLASSGAEPAKPDPVSEQAAPPTEREPEKPVQAAPAAGPAAPTAPATPPERTAKLVTTPPGAEVWREGAVVGNTPVDLKCPKEGEPEVRYAFSLAGYEKREAVLTAECVPISLTLAPAQKPQASPPPKRKRDDEAPAPEKKPRRGSDIVDPWG